MHRSGPRWSGSIASTVADVLAAFWAGRLRAALTAAIAVVALALAPACTRTQAKVTPDAPLDVPPPPPRDVEPADSEPPPLIPLVQEPARNTPARARPAPPREQPRTEPAKPEAPQPAAPADTPRPPEEPPRPPATTLQTTPPTAEGELERGVRVAIAKASADLNRVDYRALNNDARTQYDTAKGFVRQAEEAIRNKNLVFAKTLADKAVAIAAQLAPR
jgi:outer membrane biosynthesis protein TonB